MTRDREERLRPPTRPIAKAFEPGATRCPICGWKPSPYELRIGHHPSEVLEDWISCPDCYDGRLFSRSEVEALKRSGQLRREGKRKKLTRHILEARLEDVHKDHEPGGGSSGGGRGKGGKSGNSTWQPDDDRRIPTVDITTTKLENLTDEVRARLPVDMLEKLKLAADAVGSDMSAIFRESMVEWRHYIACPAPSVTGPRELTRFRVTPEQKKFFKHLAKKHGKFEEHQSGTETRMAYKLLKAWLGPVSDEESS